MYHRISKLLFKSFNGDEDYPYDDDGALDEPVSEVDRLRGQITEKIGDPDAAEEYMESGQGLLDELLANPDPQRLSALLDSEIRELRLLGVGSDIDFQSLKDSAMQAYEDAVSVGEEPRGAITKAILAIKGAWARLTGGGDKPSRPATY